MINRHMVSGLRAAQWDLSGGIHGKGEYLHVKPFQDYVKILCEVTVAVAAAG